MTGRRTSGSARVTKRSAALVATTAIVSALLPVAGAQAAPTDCATALAPAVALSDAQPGYTGISRTTEEGLTAAATSSWNGAQARSSLAMHLSVTFVVDGVPSSFSIDTRGYTSVHGHWASVGQVMPPADLKASLALLHKASPAYFYAPRELTRDQVHSKGVWPSHDVAGLLGTPMPVTSTDPGAGGSTVYTCSDGSSTARFVVGASGLLDEITLESPSGTVGSLPGFVGAAGRSASRARQLHGVTPTPSTVVDTVTYSYVVPDVHLPSMWRSTTETRLFTAFQSLHLRSSVSTTAAEVALTADGLAGGHATVAGIRRLARLMVARGNRGGLIQLRVGDHPGGVWIAATNPFTGARVAYSVLAGAHGTKVAKVG